MKVSPTNLLLFIKFEYYILVSKMTPISHNVISNIPRIILKPWKICLCRTFSCAQWNLFHFPSSQIFQHYKFINDLWNASVFATAFCATSGFSDYEEWGHKYCAPGVSIAVEAPGVTISMEDSSVFDIISPSSSMECNSWRETPKYIPPSPIFTFITIIKFSSMRLE